MDHDAPSPVPCRNVTPTAPLPLPPSHHHHPPLPSPSSKRRQTSNPTRSPREHISTPTPPATHISTPPPTIGGQETQPPAKCLPTPFAMSVTPPELDAASPDELKAKIVELHAALHAAKMSAVHYKLQYEMLAQESAAAMERMAVEARMVQTENEVIHQAQRVQATATTPLHTPDEGIIPVQKEHYRELRHQIHCLQHAKTQLEAEWRMAQARVAHQDDEIASLTDKVTLMGERIRQSREQLQRYRRSRLSPQGDATPRSAHNTPQRGPGNAPPQQQSQSQSSQPFAALLQASEMASQESARAGKRGHTRNTHSMSSLPTTPQQYLQRIQQASLQTAQRRPSPWKVPSTAPMLRTSTVHAPDVYPQPSLPVSSLTQGLQSDGTVSASGDDDSEAETDIIERDDEVRESQASRVASQTLRSSLEGQMKRESFNRRGRLDPTGEKLRQTKLLGVVRKAHVDRGDEPPAKRAKPQEGEVDFFVGENSAPSPHDRIDSSNVAAVNYPRRKGRHRSDQQPAVKRSCPSESSSGAAADLGEQQVSSEECLDGEDGKHGEQHGDGEAQEATRPPTKRGGPFPILTNPPPSTASTAAANIPLSPPPRPPHNLHHMSTRTKTTTLTRDAVFHIRELPEVIIHELPASSLIPLVRVNKHGRHATLTSACSREKLFLSPGDPKHPLLDLRQQHPHP